MRDFKKLYALMNRTERRSASLLLILIFMVSIVDMIGVASVLPFVAILTQPDLINTNSTISWFHEVLGRPSRSYFIGSVGVMFFAVLVLSLLLKALTQFHSARFLASLEANLSTRRMQYYMSQAYKWHLSANKGVLTANVAQEVALVVNLYVKNAVDFFAYMLTISTLTFVLCLVDPRLAFIVVLGTGSCFILIYLAFGRLMSGAGERRKVANEVRYRTLRDAFEGIKYTKFVRAEARIVASFYSAALEIARFQKILIIVANMPRYVLEVFAFGFVLFVLFYLMLGGGNFDAALPVLAAYALAAYRVMPALQKVYQGLAQMRLARKSLLSLSDDLVDAAERPIISNSGSLAFNDRIEFEGLSFSFDDETGRVVNDVSLSIRKGTSVAFIGETGSGKTTTIDLLLGLLEAKSGVIRIDGCVLTSRHLPWWSSIVGYVPQDIVLTDSDLASNIAFDADTIDMERVREVARIACLDRFIIEDLPQGSWASAEEGVNLSGGQRQRLGIARALYTNPEILVLDEATSALDVVTEAQVLKNIATDRPELTVISIAHRLSTVKDCDQIFIFDQGALVDQGNYAELSANSAIMRRMLEALE